MSASSSITRILPLTVESVSSGGTAISGIHRIPLGFARPAPGFRPRQLQVEPGPAAGMAEHFNRTAVLLYDAVGNRKPQSGALARRLGGKERVVNAMQVFWSDAVARVDHVNVRATVIRGRPDLEHAAAFHGVPSVQKKVQKHLLQLSRVAMNRRQHGIERRPHFYAAL